MKTKSQIKAFERPVNQAATRLTRQSVGHPDFERVRDALFKAIYYGHIQHHRLDSVTLADLAQDIQ